MLELKNPHSILAALSHRPQQVKKVYLPNRPQGAWLQVQEVAEKARVAIKSTATGTAAAHSGAYAEVMPKESLVIEDVLVTDEDHYGLWLALDQLQDPQNLGSIFRTASFFGVRGILLTREHSAPLTAAAYDVASGGMETVPFAVVPNLQRAFEKFKELPEGWILGTSEHATEPLKSQKFDRNWLVVVGNEESGMRRLTQETCDVLCGIPPAPTSGLPAVTSLNVSVAAGLIMHHFLAS